uniref:Uncharacterized protein n=1 Tax=Arundo donax TaxID=35708 RepID=A0A0A9ENB6_ARUDO
MAQPGLRTLTRRGTLSSP